MMSEQDDRNRQRKPDYFTSQLRRFDEKVSDLRSFYESLDPEEKSKFQAWLKKVKSLDEEGQAWSAQLQVCTEYDICDEDGETLRWADTKFSPQTLLAAIKTWDQGECFVPPSTLP
jgi:hypothetical protein